MNQRTNKLQVMVQMSFLLAIMVLLTFTPLGFIMIPTGAITIMHIPVIIVAVVLGPFYGGLLGGTFGVLSMIKATIGAVSPVDLLFSPVSSPNILGTIIMTMLPRILLGVVAGYLFQLLQRWDSRKIWSVAVSAAVASVVHTVLVLGCLSLFFQAITIMEVLLTLLNLNGSLEVLAAVVLSSATCEPILE